MRPHRLIAVALLLPLAVAVSAPVPKGRPDGDWPQWRGPNRDGHSPCRGLLTQWPKDGPKLLWKITDVADIGVGYGSLAVADGRAFVLGAEPTSGEGKGEEFITCLRARDGSRLWRTTLGISRGSDSYGAGPSSTPTVDGDRVYALSSVGELVCLSADKGEVKWKKNLVADFNGKEPSFGFAESPLVDGDRVIVSPGNKAGMVALDKNTGKLLWQCADGAENAGYSSAIVVEACGVRQYVRQTAMTAVGVRAKDGKTLWTLGDEDRETSGITTAVAADGLVFFTTSGDKQGGSCFKLEKDGDGVKATKVFSQNKVLANQFGGVVAVGGFMYGYSATGNQWVCFDFKKGGDAAAWKAKGVEKGSVIAAADHLYCYGSKDGTCALVKATEKEYTEVSKFAIPEPSKLRPKDGGAFTLPAIANGRLFLRDFEKLYVFDIAGR